MHCEDNSSIPTHCLQHGLSHPTDTALMSKCLKTHDEVCSECINIITTIKHIEDQIILMPDTHAKSVLMLDTKDAKAKIMEWQKHIIRGVKQDQARDAAFSNLGATEALWIRDFAQKINPSKVFMLLLHENLLSNI